MFQAISKRGVGEQMNVTKLAKKSNAQLTTLPPPILLGLTSLNTEKNS